MQVTYEEAESLYEDGIINKEELLEYEKVCCIKPAILSPLNILLYPGQFDKLWEKNTAAEYRGPFLTGYGHFGPLTKLFGCCIIELFDD
jgi:hypothetical protein